MLKKLKEWNYIERHVKQPVSQLIELAALIRSKHNHIAICPTPTAYHWLGVNNATKGLFGTMLLELPQFYSNSVYSDKELFTLGRALNAMRFSNIVFSGFAPYFVNIIDQLKDERTKICLIYHGFFSEFSDNPRQRDMFSMILKLCQENRIQKLGFNKKGFSETIQAIYGIKTYDLLLKTKVPFSLLPLKSATDGKTHIGVMVNKQFRKNLHNQVAAALMVENSIVHVSDDSELSYFGKGERIVAHGSVMCHEKYLQLLGSNDLNLYVSYSESWGMVISESIAMGTPCLASYTSSIFDGNDFLKQNLVVHDFDNSNAIYQQIRSVLCQRWKLSEMGSKYIHELNGLAERKLEDFLNT